LSPLTKTLVVLVTLLSIVLVAIVVPFAANTQDLRAKLTEVRAERDTAQVKASNATDELAAIREQKNTRIAELEDRVAELENTVSEKNSEITNLDQDIQDARTRNQQLAGSLDVLSAQVSQIAAVNETKTQQLSDARDKLIDLQKKNIEATNRIAKLESSLDSQVRQVRSYKEQYQQARDRVATLETRWQEVPSPVKQSITGEGEDQQPVTPVPEPIAGQVTGVNQPSEEVTLVQINVGENDRVQKNMKFMVHRGDQYIGTLVIDRVDADQAVGRMTLQQTNVQAGDRIYAGT
jgi:septal ring factor EnvC (AmiA/AmiB activator)